MQIVSQLWCIIAPRVNETYCVLLVAIVHDSEVIGMQGDNGSGSIATMQALII